MRSSINNTNSERTKRSFRRDISDLFSKRRGNRESFEVLESPPSVSRSSTGVTATSSSKRSNQNTFRRGIKLLQSMFPAWELEPLKLVFEAHEFVMENTIAAILRMNETQSCITDEMQDEVTNYHESMFDATEGNLLPIDFLQLPTECIDDIDNDDEDGATSDDGTEELKRSVCKDSAFESDDVTNAISGDDQAIERDESHERKANIPERSDSLAEDDGTLFGRVYTGDVGDVDEEVVHPVLNADQLVAKRQFVSDSVNQMFIPPELRNVRPSIMDTSSIDVIKRSRLNLTDAEKRIQHREPHLAFELLSKASEIYRNGVISSQELDTLRSYTLPLIQPSRMLIDNTTKTDRLISDHEWHLLILKCKNIRQGLSIRLVHEQVGKPEFRNARPTEYLIRIVDIETGIVWFTTKRQKDILKLYRKLCKISQRIREISLASRLSQIRNTNDGFAKSQARLLEGFLRSAATLVTPSPLTFLHGVALKELHQFLQVPAESMMHPKRTHQLSRQLRVYVYHTVNDNTSPEGKACLRFEQKLQKLGDEHSIDVLNEMGDLLDGLQEYMLEHRFQEMKQFAERLIKLYTTPANMVIQVFSNESSNMPKRRLKSRNNSYVNILASLDQQTRNDRLYAFISDSIRPELEERICVSVMKDLNQALRKMVADKEIQFQSRLRVLRNQSQESIGISSSKTSPSNWRLAVQTIKEMDGAFLPWDKMARLVTCAHQIHDLYRSEHAVSSVMDEANSHGYHQDSHSEVSCHSSGPSNMKEELLSGDDFLPIFIYVLIHCNLESPVMTQVLLNRLCDPEKRHSEAGYYLATFEAAVHHILSADRDMF